jgi:outer membrane protein
MTVRRLELALALTLTLASIGTARTARAQATPERFDIEAALRDGTRPLTPEEAVQLALEHSPRIDVAALGVTAARAALSAATVALVPRLDGTARYAHVDGFPDGQIVTPAGALTIRIPRDQFAFSARLSVPISDIFFAALPTMEAAADRVDAEELRVDAARADVALSVIEAYFRYVEARGVVAVATSARDQAVIARDQVARYAQAGILNPADTAAAEARVAQAEEGIARGEAAVGVTGASLSILMGTPASERYQVESAIAWEGPQAAGGIEALEATALDHRPEVRALREALGAQMHLLDATRAGGYPHVGVYGYAEESNPNPRVFPPREEFLPLWELGATLTWSPNDLATSIYRAEELSAQIERSMHELEVAEDGVRLEVRQAYEELRASARSIEAARESMAAAEESYRARLAQLAAGEAIVTDLLAADSRVAEARLALLRVRVAANMASARLQRATGASGR